MIDPPGARVLLLDVEGTTTSGRFVSDVLFPYARGRLEAFLREHARAPEIADDLRALRDEHAREDPAQAPPPWKDDPPAEEIASAARYALWLMDRDRKSTGLKSLQGHVWESGYRSGTIVAHVYPDVPKAFSRWRAQGRVVAIFSSGSVLAQRLLFAHTAAGDLTPFLDALFDTTLGAKRDPASYLGIAEALRVQPAAVLFVSDVGEELDAARAAGTRTVLCVRERPPSRRLDHPMVHSFDAVYP